MSKLPVNTGLISGKTRGSCCRRLLTPALVAILTLLLAYPVTLSARNRAELTYNLRYGFVKGGEARIVITDTIYNGRKAVYYYMEGRTSGLTDKLYRVSNVYESIVDAGTYLPIKAVRNVREGSYRYYNEVFFYHAKDSIFSKRTGGIKVPRNLTDILSVFFYFVKQDYITKVEKGRYIELPVINGHRISTIKIKHDGIQTVDTELGKVSSYILLPEVEKGKVLKNSDGLTFYISEKEKVPVQFDLDLKVGTLRAILSGFKLNGQDVKNF
ncbi:MAG: DUF3108 domain-containing protein [Bacteroidota bacterium]